jgi:hypothetical protein
MDGKFYMSEGDALALERNLIMAPTPYGLILDGPDEKGVFTTPLIKGEYDLIYDFPRNKWVAMKREKTTSKKAKEEDGEQVPAGTTVDPK